MNHENLFLKAVVTKDAAQLGELLKNLGARLTDNFSAQLLYQVTSNGCLACLKLLYLHGYDINITQQNGSTPLHNAATHGTIDCVKFLVANGANINATDLFQGLTPLHDAMYNGQLECAKFLLAHNADTNIKDKSGRTAIDTALSSDFDDIVDLANDFIQSKREKAQLDQLIQAPNDTRGVIF